MRSRGSLQSCAGQTTSPHGRNLGEPIWRFIRTEPTRRPKAGGELDVRFWGSMIRPVTSAMGSGTDRPLRSILSAVPDHILCESADDRFASSFRPFRFSVQPPKNCHWLADRTNAHGGVDCEQAAFEMAALGRTFDDFRTIAGGSIWEIGIGPRLSCSIRTPPGATPRHQRSRPAKEGRDGFTLSPSWSASVRAPS